jgi:hypothetical protein
MVEQFAPAAVDGSQHIAIDLRLIALTVSLVGAVLAHLLGGKSTRPAVRRHGTDAIAAQQHGKVSADLFG